MRFLVDMPLSVHTAAFLRQLGHDVVHLRDVGMNRAPDNEVVERARKEQRIVLTLDLGLAVSRKLEKFRIKKA